MAWIREAVEFKVSPDSSAEKLDSLVASATELSIVVQPGMAQAAARVKRVKK